jgi:hypothetical protein
VIGLSRMWAPKDKESAMSEYDEYDADQEAEMRDIREEGQEYSTNVHRSDEEGWFYPDDDEEIE